VSYTVNTSRPHRNIMVSYTILNRPCSLSHKFCVSQWLEKCLHSVRVRT
jgi:hypothetical protein